MINVDRKINKIGIDLDGKGKSHNELVEVVATKACKYGMIQTKKTRNGRTVPSFSSSTDTRSRAPSSATSSPGDPRGAILKLTPSMSASKSIQLIRDFFGLSYTATSNFPCEEDRHEAESFDDLKKGTRVVLFLVSTLQKMMIYQVKRKLDNTLPHLLPSTKNMGLFI